MKRIIIAVAILIAAAIQPLRLRGEITPSGGEIKGGYRPGMTVNVTWDGVLAAQYVDVCIWDGDRGQLTILATRVIASVGVYPVTIPIASMPGVHYRFVVRDSDVPQKAEFSPGFIRVSNIQPIVASTDEEHDQLKLVCSPLPAHERVDVQWNGIRIKQLELRDASDRVVLDMTPHDNSTACTLNITACATGLYVLRATTADDDVLLRRVVVLR